MANFRTPLWLVSCAAVCMVGLASAQTVPAAAGAAPTVDEVVAKNLAAKGGVDLLRTTNTVKMTGRVTSGKATMTMTVWAKRPDRRRTEAERDGQKLVEAFDGTSGWVKMGGMPAQAVPPGPILDAARRQAEFDTGLLNYKERGHSIELVGKGPVDGLYHLKITPKDGPVTHYYIDAATGLERKTVTSLPVGPKGAPAVLETRFSDFREVDGRKVPFSVEQIIDGKPVAKTELTTIEFNVPIDDAFFRMPPR